MKNVLILCISITAFACGTQKQILLKETNQETTVEDSVTYELIVLDSGFETWFITKSKPSWYHSQEYYENWNQQYVNAWNHRSIWKHNSQLLEGQINYEPQTDYGLEINHKLFYYFQYVERELGIPIIDNGPNAI